jgi:hypothetical protein
MSFRAKPASLVRQNGEQTVDHLGFLITMPSLMTKRLLLIAVFVLLATGYFAAFTIFNRNPAPPPTPPRPNGYDDFVAATKFIPAINLRDPMEAAELRDLVMPNAEATRLLQSGLSRQCVVPAERMTTLQTVSDDLSGLKRLAQFLRAAGQLAELEGRTNEAVQTYLDCIHLGNESSRGGLNIHRLVGIACEATGLDPLARSVVFLTPEQQLQVAQRLLDMDAEAVPLAEIWETENRFTRSRFPPQWNPVSWMRNMWQNHQVKKKTTAKNNMVAAHRRLIAIELGLRCYWSKHGKLPAQLDELAPEFLTHIPPDPFSNQAMIYRPLGTNWLLYSVGVDAVDNGGIPAKRLVNTEGDLFFDTR